MAKSLRSKRERKLRAIKKETLDKKERVKVEERSEKLKQIIEEQNAEIADIVPTPSAVDSASMEIEKTTDSKKPKKSLQSMRKRMRLAAKKKIGKTQRKHRKPKRN
eukprot:CAMPEP_0184656122 /NCGR_PEP_ID=MMETSP0308-20130426/15666_1 /TAXON_ID=38269 /ORGANISM="Gloeochaete witrockiana, Strain SAG 46.84" /LENGTH=105 /DNA_ID=CAMNT_0027093065 /DNA_START=87 /DNA_END=404 /DNA_ORIENTATION=+